MDLGLQGRVALVTASSKGLGRATARALSEEGAKVVMCAREKAALTEAAEAVPGETLALSNTARTGLWAWAKTAAADLFEEHITLNLACPGTHDTERARQAGQLSGPVGDPADFGKVVCFLCSDPARFVSGTALLVDGATTRGLL
jgi:3-oxoacyl-[acyl-carrier protein] reductase